MRIRSVTTHVLGVSAQALVIFAIIAAILMTLAPIYRPANFLAGTDRAMAAKNAGTSAGISVPDTTFGGTSVAVAGAGKWIYATCYQYGQLVYGQYKQVDLTGHAVLGYFGPTPTWSGGSAECTAQEGTWSRNGRWRGGASTTFNVAG
jgi:hypothetical protein